MLLKTLNVRKEFIKYLICNLLMRQKIILDITQSVENLVNKLNIFNLTAASFEDILANSNRGEML